MNKNILKNSDGILTFDYMFAIVLAGGFMVILFSLSMTLSMVDVVQYMTFSSARVAAVASDSITSSEAYAYDKFTELYTNPVIQPLFERAEWFEVGEPEVGDFSDQYPSNSPNRNTFYGVSVRFQAKMLDLRIPFYGSTNTRDDGEGFSSQIHSFLGREPSTQDCQNFTDQRLKWLYQYYDNPILRNSLQEYKSITDNGC